MATVDSPDRQAVKSLGEARVTIALDHCGRATVQRDLDLIRRILIEVQAWPDAEGRAVQFDDVDEAVVFRHVEMLAEGGYLAVIGRADSLLSREPPRLVIKDMTWKGHDFLGSIQNDRVYGAIKQELSAKHLISVSLDVVLEMAKALAKQHLGLG